MSLIWIDEKTFQAHVKHTPTEGFLPSEESIAIEKYGKLIKEQLDEFLKDKHNPMVKKLLEMVSAYNYKNNPEYKAQMDAQKKQMEDYEQAKKRTAAVLNKPKKKKRR